jgi:hypothetical protein
MGLGFLNDMLRRRRRSQGGGGGANGAGNRRKSEHHLLHHPTAMEGALLLTPSASARALGASLHPLLLDILPGFSTSRPASRSGPEALGVGMGVTSARRTSRPPSPQAGTPGGGGGGSPKAAAGPARRVRTTRSRRSPEPRPPDRLMLYVCAPRCVWQPSQGKKDRIMRFGRGAILLHQGDPTVQEIMVVTRGTCRVVVDLGPWASGGHLLTSQQRSYHSLTPVLVETTGFETRVGVYCGPARARPYTKWFGVVALPFVHRWTSAR